MRNLFSLGVLLCAATLAHPAEPAVPTIDGPLSPEDAPKSFRLEPGLRIELVAAEPMVVSPVAIAFDERGRLYVAENRGYPTGPGEGKPPAGRIALLEDTDRDGRMDRRSEFAEGLTFPNGVLPWNGGVIVTCAPEILYLKDTDGDGRADEKKVLFTGFATTGSTQLRVSHPTLSPDGWVYVTSGLTGGSVTSPSEPGKPAVELKRTDFRFRPDGSQGQAADGGAQYGLTFDDFGRRFICYNRVQVQHVVLSSQVLRRNPKLAFSETVQNCPADMQAEPLKGHGAAARLFPISQNVTTADSHAGTFTAACGLLIYRGDGLPDTYRGCAFSCDPTGNLVHVDRLQPAGATFSAHRMRDGIEFLSSSDNWFRPVFLAHGPDGAIYVCDMYRKTIEHPDYLPVEIRKHTDFESGKDKGRIWRVVQDDIPATELRARRDDLSHARTEELVGLLSHSNGWRRSLAVRLLLECKDASAVPVLQKFVQDPAASAVAVFAAINVLEEQAGLDDALLEGLLKHIAAPVRERAVQLAELRLPKSKEWLERLFKLDTDPDGRVRFQLAISLGSAKCDSNCDEARIASSLVKIAARDGSDRWLRAAIFSSLNEDRSLYFLSNLARQKRPEGGLPGDLLREFGRLLGAMHNPLESRGIIDTIVRGEDPFAADEQAALLTGFAEAARSKVPTSESGVLVAALGKEPPAELVTAVNAVFQSALKIAADESQPLEHRRSAVELLAFAPFESAGETLLKLAEPQQPSELATAAVRSLGMLHDPNIAAVLLDADRFRASPPRIRDEILTAMLTQGHHLAGLMTALENGEVSTGDVDALRRRQLTEHRDPEIRQRAVKLFGAVSGDRAKVYEEYKPVADEKGNAENGRAVFKKQCAQCHRLDREGYAVGPDLFGIRNQPKASILMHILVPEQEITQGFTAYTALTKDGRTLTGLISAETPTSITLRQPQGKEDTLLRSDLDELVASRLSLMPQGLEKNLTKQEFADLLAYLKGEK